MQNVTEPSIEYLLLELKKRAKEELVTNSAAYEELVDDLIAEKIEWGEMNEDDDIQVMREDLIGRWSDIEKYMMSMGTDNP